MEEEKDITKKDDIEESSSKNKNRDIIENKSKDLSEEGMKDKEKKNIDSEGEIKEMKDEIKNDIVEKNKEEIKEENREGKGIGEDKNDRGIEGKKEERKDEENIKSSNKEKMEEKENEEKKKERKDGEDMGNNKKENNDSEKICETFEISNEKGKHEIQSCNSVSKKHADKEELKKHNIILRNIFIVLGIIIIGFVAWMIFLNFIGNVESNGLSFEVVSEGNLIFYKYVLPLYNEDVHYANYNFFLRKNPYKTDKVDFDGELNIRNFVAINSTEFKCEGKGILAMANLVKPFEVSGITVVQDPNATCDEDSRYMLLHIFQGEENKIVQTGETCYDMSVKDCDILDVSERMMIEMFKLLEAANEEIEKKDFNEAEIVL